MGAIWLHASASTGGMLAGVVCCSSLQTITIGGWFRSFRSARASSVPDDALYELTTSSSASGATSSTSASADRSSTSTLVTSARLSTLDFISPRLFWMNDCTWPSAVPSSSTAAPSWLRCPARKPVTLVSWSVNCRTVASLLASVWVNFDRLSTVANRSPLLLSNVVDSWDSWVMVSCRFCPLPLRLAASVFSRSDRLPLAFAPFGPSDEETLSRLA
jgi:hypothetical protein